MHKGFLLSAAILGAIAVGLGAFGAHGLKQIVPAETITTFDTGVKYQFYHVFALFITGILYASYPVRALRIAGILFLVGILFFCGSLYALTLLKATGSVGLGGIGIITPIGGLFFIAGWLSLFWGIWKSKTN